MFQILLQQFSSVLSVCDLLMLESSEACRSFACDLYVLMFEVVDTDMERKQVPTVACAPSLVVKMVAVWSQGRGFDSRFCQMMCVIRHVDVWIDSVIDWD